MVEKPVEYMKTFCDVCIAIDEEQRSMHVTDKCRNCGKDICGSHSVELSFMWHYYLCEKCAAEPKLAPKIEKIRKAALRLQTAEAKLTQERDKLEFNVKKAKDALIKLLRHD